MRGHGDHCSICRRLEAENDELKAKRGELDAWSKRARVAEAQVSELRDQIPASMEDSKILFIACREGHGRLTATNWIDHGCPVCQIDERDTEIIRLQGVARDFSTWLADAKVYQMRVEKAVKGMAGKLGRALE